MDPAVQWTENSEHRMVLADSATISTLAPCETLFMYLDESGNFDFGGKGTRYFIMTCVVSQRPFPACHDLMDAKYDCFENGVTLKKFHATEDNEETRKDVYSIIEKHKDRYSAYSVYIDKRSLDEDMRNPTVLYSRVFEWLLDEVFASEMTPGVKKVVAVTDDIPKAAKEKQVSRPLKTFLKRKSAEAGVTYTLEHYPSESDFNLQIADYACWAFKRLKDGKDWPYSKIASMFAKTGNVG